MRRIFWDDNRNSGTGSAAFHLLRQCLDNRVNRVAGLGTHFIVCRILDGMVDENTSGVFHAQCGCLCVCRVDEFRGRDGD